jgi:hypothetical protein
MLDISTLETWLWDAHLHDTDAAIALGATMHRPTFTPLEEATVLLREAEEERSGFRHG